MCPSHTPSDDRVEVKSKFTCLESCVSFPIIKLPPPLKENLPSGGCGVAQAEKCPSHIAQPSSEGSSVTESVLWTTVTPALML